MERMLGMEEPHEGNKWSVMEEPLFVLVILLSQSAAIERG